VIEKEQEKLKQAQLLLEKRQQHLETIQSL
jgi:hypothetical protein